MGKWITIGSLAFVLLIIVGMAGCPVYNVWERGLAGKAALKPAEWDRQIAIKEAEPKTQAARTGLEQHYRARRPDRHGALRRMGPAQYDSRVVRYGRSARSYECGRDRDRAAFVAVQA